MVAMNSQFFKPVLQVVCLFVLMASAAASQAAVLKIATLSPDGSAWMKKMREGADQVEQKTSGRVKFKFYPGGVMGDDAAVLRKMRIGQLQGGAITSGALASVYPDSQVYNLPLLFKSFDEVDYVRHATDPTLEKGFEDRGFVTFGFAEGGLAYAMTKGEAIHKPTDLYHHKVWSPNDDNLSALTFAAMNVTPIPLGLGDVLAGLQTNLIDTITCPPIPALVMQWHSQMTSVTDVPMLYIYAMLAVDKKSFDAIPAADQAIVRDEMHKVFAELDQQNRKDNINAFETLGKQNIKVVSPNEQDRQAWYELGDKAQRQLIEQGIVSKEMYAKAADLLKAFRSGQGSAAKK
jgi:TRAP-type C4-dicarboxylate transport system substrate-binding protein